MNKPFILDKKKLVDLYIKQRLPSEEVAQILGCSDSHVLKFLHLYDIPVRKKQERIPGLTESNLRNLYENYKWSTIKISKYLNCNDESVRQALRRHGIAIRSRSDAAKIKDIKPEERKRLKTHFEKLNLNKMGKDHPSWKGGRYIDSYGYVIRRIDGKVIKEHRHVMEKHLGRKLEPWEEVNHKNLNKQDNSLGNLEVIYSEHKHKDYIARQKLKSI